MNYKKYLWVFGLVCSIILGSCSEKKSTFFAEPKTIKLEVNALEEAFAKAKNVQSIDSILLANPDVLEIYFKTKKSQSAALANSLFQIYQNKEFQQFYQQSRSSEFFGDNTWKKQLEKAFQQLAELYPNWKAPKIKTVFTGFGGAGQFPSQHLVVTDSLIVVGLDYFMGKKGMFLPPEVFDYQMKRLEPNGLVGQILLLYGDVFNKHQGTNRTLLNDMIWYGKNYYFAKQLAPEVPDSTLFGYSADEIAGAQKFQNLIWEHFIANALFYKKDEFLKTKYVGERPKTPEIGPACPGAIGRWLGYIIVKEYGVKYPDKKLSEIMQIADADLLLRDSGYRGKGNSEE